MRSATERKGQREFGDLLPTRPPAPASPCPNPNTAGITYQNRQAGPVGLCYDSAQSGRDEWKSTTPRATVDFKLNEDVTLFAIWAKGYKPGGFNGLTALTNGRPLDESFKQEESVNYEIGMKSQLMDRRVMLNVSLFKMTIDDIQLTTPIANATTGAVTSISTNQGDGEIKGVEIESRFAATDDLTLGFTYALADTEFTSGCDDFQWNLTSGGGVFNPANPTDPARNLNGRGSCSIAGNPFPLAAKHTGSITADYSRPVFGGDYRLYVNSDLSYTGKKNVQVHNTAYTGSALLMGARVGIETDSWKVGLYGRNLLDETSAVGATRWLHGYLLGFEGPVPAATLDPGLPPTSVAAYSLPRGIFGTLRRESQIGLELSYKF
jgi:outer membrane receptor protein involved in Fe transport